MLAGRAVPRSWWVLALLLHVLPFATRPALIGGDEVHYALASHAIAVQHTVDLRQAYLDVAAGSPAAGVRHAGKRLVPHLRRVGSREGFTHDLGLPVLLAPLLELELARWPRAAPDLLLGAVGLALTFAALLAGCRALGEWIGDARLGAAAGLLAYFGSPLWFGSRTFFAEPYVWAFTVLAVVAAARQRWVLASSLLGVALLTKETALLLVGAALLAVGLSRGLWRAASLGIGPLLAAGLHLALHQLAFGSWRELPQPFAAGNPLSGALGVLIEPTRGLLWYAPVLLAGMLGWRHERLRCADLAAATAFVGYYALTACWVDWRGGTGFGPRLLLPALPGLSLPLARLLRRDPAPVARGLLGGLAVVGFTVGWCAALHPLDAFWGATGAALLIGHPLEAVVGVALGAGAALVLLASPQKTAVDARAEAPG